MREWDNSRAPQIGDRRVTPGCAFLFIVIFFAVIMFGIGLIHWTGTWLGGLLNV